MDATTDFRGETRESDYNEHEDSEVCVLVCASKWFFLISSLFVLGILCNLVIICALCKNAVVKPNTQFLLQMIATADTVYLIMATLSGSPHSNLITLKCQEACESDEESRRSLALWESDGENITRPFALTALTMSLWIAMLLTFEHYVTIGRPGESCLSSRRMYMAVSATFFVFAELNFMLNTYYRLLIPIRSVVPMFVLVRCVFPLIGFSFCGNHGDQMTNDVTVETERDWTKVVTAVVIMTILSQIAFDLGELAYWYTFHSGNPRLPIYMYVYVAGWTSVAFSSSFKIVIYVAVLGARFRDSLGLCCCCCCFRPDVTERAPEVQLNDVNATADDRLWPDPDC